MAKSMPTTITNFDRTPGSVFVNVSPPKPVQQAQQGCRYHRDWTDVVSGIASDAALDTPTAVEIPTKESKPRSANDVVIEALSHSTLARSYDWISEKTGLNALTVHIACRELTDSGFLECETSITGKKFRLKSSTPTDIRIYSEDVMTGKRRTLYTGEKQADTAELCQSYANLAGHRVECHDAVNSEVYLPKTYPMPTLADWVQVYNADDGTLIWCGLIHEGFDTRCRVYADRKGVGLRVDYSHENRSQFYTPRNEQLRYGRQNAEHYARRHGLEVS